MAGMSFDELKNTKEFRGLTPKQRKFVELYIAYDYNPIPSCREAYGCKSDEVAKVMSYAVLRSLDVTYVLALHYGEQPRATFVRHVERLVRSRKITIAQLKAWQWLAELHGHTVNVLEKSKPEPKRESKRESKPTDESYGLGEFDP